MTFLSIDSVICISHLVITKIVLIHIFGWTFLIWHTDSDIIIFYNFNFHSPNVFLSICRNHTTVTRAVSSSFLSCDGDLIGSITFTKRIHKFKTKRNWCLSWIMITCDMEKSVKIKKWRKLTIPKWMIICVISMGQMAKSENWRNQNETITSIWLRETYNGVNGNDSCPQMTFRER